MKQCIECKKTFPADELLNYGEHLVCPGCKERLLDKLKQGLPAGSGPWRQNRFGQQLIVIPRGSFRFPKRCIKCNAPATEKIFRVLRWSPSFRLVVRMGDFGQPVNLPVCAVHRQRCDFIYRWRYALLAGKITLGLMVIVALLAAGGMLGLIICLCLFSIAYPIDCFFRNYINVLFVTRMNDSCVFAKGAGRAYWESLPPYSG